MSAEFLIFDRALKQKQHTRADIAKADYLIREVAERLFERIDGINRQFDHCTDLSPFPDYSAPLLREKPSVKELENHVITDEFLPLQKASANLITSLLDLHWVNDLPGALIQIRQALKADGLFLGAMFGGKTLHELRQAQIQAETDLYGGISPRIAPFADLRDAAGLLQRAGFSLPVADVETITVIYPDAQTLMRDLKNMGEQNALLKRPNTMVSKRWIEAVNHFYQQAFGTEDGIPATFEIVSLTGWSEGS